MKRNLSMERPRIERAVEIGPADPRQPQRQRTTDHNQQLQHVAIVAGAVMGSAEMKARLQFLEPVLDDDDRAFRALLVALDELVSEDKMPPRSRVARRSDGTLVRSVQRRVARRSTFSKRRWVMKVLSAAIVVGALTAF